MLYHVYKCLPELAVSFQRASHSRKQTLNRARQRNKIDTHHCMKSDNLLNSSYLDKWVRVSYRNPKMLNAFLTHLFWCMGVACWSIQRLPVMLLAGRAGWADGKQAGPGVSAWKRSPVWRPQPTYLLLGSSSEPLRKTEKKNAWDWMDSVFFSFSAVVSGKMILDESTRKFSSQSRP